MANNNKLLKRPGENSVHSWLDLDGAWNGVGGGWRGGMEWGGGGSTLVQKMGNTNLHPRDAGSKPFTPTQRKSERIRDRSCYLLTGKVRDRSYYFLTAKIRYSSYYFLTAKIRDRSYYFLTAKIRERSH